MPAAAVESISDLVFVEIPGRCWTLNAERTWTWPQRAAHVKEWRTAGWAAAIEQKLAPFVGPVAVEALPIVRDNRRGDCAGAFPTVKAVLDGLVDAGVLPHDGPDIVRSMTMYAPEHGPADVLRILLRSAA